jgi:serine/threonine-protein kinase
MATQEFAGYRLIEKLGVGGSAVVYRARRKGGNEVALKILHEDGVTEQMRVRFSREIDALGKLDHPKILKILDSGQVGERLWYAMEYSSKRSLEAVFLERHSGGGILTLSECFHLARGLGDSLGYLHSEKLVHRDLKPDNILVDETLDPTIMDFGLAKDQERSEMTAEGLILGTPRYMAPEQTQGQAADFSSDVYQVGLVLYRALTGKLPLEEKNPFATAMRRMREAIPPPSTVRPDIPPGLDRILLKALRFQYLERYPDMGVFAQELARLHPDTGELLPGESMPGAVAEKHPEAPAVPPRTQEVTLVGGEGFARACGNTLPIRRASPTTSAGVNLPPRPVSRVPLWILGLVLGGLGALGVLFSGGPTAKPPKISGLEVRLKGEQIQIYFETDQPVRSFLRLDPPMGSLLPIQPQTSKLHARTLDLGQENPSQYQLVLETGRGKRFQLPSEELGEVGSERRYLGLGIKERRQDERATVQFQTGEEAQCLLHYGSDESLDRLGKVQLTGGTHHVFELGPLEPGGIIRYQIEIRVGGKVRLSSVQTLSE